MTNQIPIIHDGVFSLSLSFWFHSELSSALSLFLTQNGPFLPTQRQWLLRIRPCRVVATSSSSKMDHYLIHWLRMFTNERHRKEPSDITNDLQDDQVMTVLCLPEKQSIRMRITVNLLPVLLCTLVILVAETQGIFAIFVCFCLVALPFVACIYGTQLSVLAEWKRTKKQPELLSRPSQICKGWYHSRARQLLVIVRLFADKHPLALPSPSVCLFASSFSHIYGSYFNLSCLTRLDYSTSRCQSIDTGDVKRREHVKDVPGVNYFEKICLRRNLF